VRTNAGKPFTQTCKNTITSFEFFRTDLNDPILDDILLT
jgi:hypothetical protein